MAGCRCDDPVRRLWVADGIFKLRGPIALVSEHICGGHPTRCAFVKIRGARRVTGGMCGWCVGGVWADRIWAKLR